MAAIPNPYYSAQWQMELARAEARLAQCARRAAEIAADDGFGGRRHLAALAALDDARLGVAAAARSRHLSIADYAAWRFAALDEGKADVLVQDFTAFTAIEEVDSAFSRAQSRVAETPFAGALFLAVRQPAGLAAFAAAGDIISSPRRFLPGELGQQGRETLDCIVSFQQLGPMFHICIAHRWGALALGSEDRFRLIATRLARQTIEMLLPRAALIFHGGQHAAPSHRELIREVNAQARQFCFYRHLLPARGMKEQFCRVDMGWDGTRFVDPDFSACLYEAIPPALRDVAIRDAGMPGLSGPEV